MKKYILISLLSVLLMCPFAIWAQNEESAFITSWSADAEEPISIGLNETLIYNFNYIWKDATSEIILSGTHTNADGIFTTNFTNEGTYTLEITGTFPHLTNDYPKERLLDVLQWGDIVWESFNSSFSDWEGAAFSAADVPDLRQTTDMSLMFYRASAFDGDLSNWDVSNVKNMGLMFSNASAFNGDISSWDVSQVTSMRYMFRKAYAFNGNLNNWDVSGVTNMESMFTEATSFTGDISLWNVTNVTTMSGMFFKATSFNGDLKGWDVSQVNNMQLMFNQATSFAGDLSTWNVSNVKNMSSMFGGASTFNSNIGGWNVSQVSNVNDMFNGATSFNQDLANWDISSLVTGALSGANRMFKQSGLTSFNYDNILKGWASQENIPTGIVLGVEGVIFCTEAESRDKLINDFGWTITDDGHHCTETNILSFSVPQQIGLARIDNANHMIQVDVPAGTDRSAIAPTLILSDGATSSPASGDIVDFSLSQDEPVIFTVLGDDGVTTQEWKIKVREKGRPFITKWSLLAGFDAVIELNPEYIYSFTYVWKNSNGTIVKSGIHTSAQGDFRTKFLFAQGSYTLEIEGDFPHLSFSPKHRLKNVKKWGDIAWKSFEGSFQNWDGQRFQANDVPDLSRVTSMQSMFKNATSFNKDLSNWDVSQATNMDFMFHNAKSYNRDLGNWDISQVNSMEGMLDHVNLSLTNYDKLLKGWASQDLQHGVTLGAIGQAFCEEEEARDRLISAFGWQITDDGQKCQGTDILSFSVPTQTKPAIIDKEKYAIIVEVPEGTNVSALTPTVTLSEGATSSPSSGETVDFTDVVTYTVTAQDQVTKQDWHIIVQHSDARPFITQWNLSSFDRSIQFELDPAYRYGFTYQWKAANGEEVESGIYTSVGGSFSTIFEEPGTYSLEITGTFPHFLSSDQLVDVQQWGDQSWRSFESSFSFWRGTSFSATDTPDLSRVTSMKEMFYRASLFNGDLSNWSVNNISSTEHMFNSAVSFDGDLGSWDVSNLKNASDMLTNSGLSSDNYDKLLTGWATQQLQTGVSFSGDIGFCTAGESREKLINDFGWKIDDAGQFCGEDILEFIIPGQIGPTLFDRNKRIVFVEVAEGTDLSALSPIVTLSEGASSVPSSGDIVDFSGPVTFSVNSQLGSSKDWTVRVVEFSRPFVTSWNVPSGSPVITINFSQGFYDFFYVLKTANGEVHEMGRRSSNSSSSLRLGNIPPGINTLEIRGIFPYFGIYSSKDRLLDVLQWGDIEWRNFDQTFREWKGSTFSAADAPDLSQVSRMVETFRSAEFFNADLSHWDVSNVNNMRSMFEEATSFNNDLSNWNVSSLTIAFNMFTNSGLDSINYDKILIGWAAQNVQNGVRLGADGITFCDGAEARNSLINDHGWLISDGGEDCGEELSQLKPVVDELENPEEILVYPNPVSSIVSIETEETSEVRVTDLAGFELMSPQSGNMFQIDLTGVKEGIYLIIIRRDQKVVTRKIYKKD